MSLIDLDKLTAQLPERDRRELLRYARRRNAQAVALAAVVIAFWLVVIFMIAIVVVLDK